MPGVEPGQLECALALIQFDTNRTPISKVKQAVPPILFYPPSVSPDKSDGRDCLAECDPTLTPPLRREPIALARHRSHPPCSQLDIHPAAIVSNDAGGLLPHRFILRPLLPCPAVNGGTGIRGEGCFLLQLSSRLRAPSLAVSRGNRVQEDRESGSSSRWYERRIACLFETLVSSEATGNRTLNPQLKRLLLCQLS